MSRQSGLNQDPPTLRIQEQSDGSWVVLDITTWVADASDRHDAIRTAGSRLAGRGFVYVVNQLGQVLETIDAKAPEIVEAQADPNSTPGRRVVPESAGTPVTPSRESTEPEPTVPIRQRSSDSALRKLWDGDAAEELHWIHILLEGLKAAALPGGVIGFLVLVWAALKHGAGF